MPDLNVLGTPMEPCGAEPLTGFYRDGCCTSGPEDVGLHTICAVMTSEFLEHQGLIGNDIPEVSMTSATAPGVTRTWTRVQDYYDEVALARIYGGFHYRFSNKVGQDMGRKIAELAIAARMRRLEASNEPRR